MDNQNQNLQFETLTINSFSNVPSNLRFTFMKWWISAKKLSLILSASQNLQKWQEIEDLDMLSLDMGIVQALGQNGSGYAGDYPNLAQRDFRKTLTKAPEFRLSRPILRQVCQKCLEACQLCLSLLGSKLLNSKVLLSMVEMQVSSFNDTFDSVFCSLRPTGFEQYPQGMEDDALVLQVSGTLYAARFLQEMANNRNLICFEENREQRRSMKKKFARTMPKSLRTVVEMGVIGQDKMDNLRRQFDDV